MFYNQHSRVEGNLGKVLDDLTFTEDSSSSARTIPAVSLNKVDSEDETEKILPVPSEHVLPKRVVPKVKSPPTLLGKRMRAVEDDLNQLFEDSNLPRIDCLLKTNSYPCNHRQESLERNSCPKSKVLFRPNKRVAKAEEKETDSIIRNTKPSNISGIPNSMVNPVPSDSKSTCTNSSLTGCTSDERDHSDSHDREPEVSDFIPPIQPKIFAVKPIT